ncbi:NUDIX domain-containing protein [Pelobacter seleniigenes]|uniref:NUDIX domain-containing protein n=1 Tax=Pelobacter seleniigenes TaxID=407188 RepID=UPI0004A76F29|nr:NUDIX hydrolase [Pelobacter seleniigenes]
MSFKISAFTVTNLADNRFVKPVRLHYIQNGQPRDWEAVQAHDSVAILLYHRQRQAFLLVKQFRPAVYMNYPQFNHTYELCAGIVDKKLPLEQIAKEEIFEECGFDLPLSKIIPISSFFTNVGITGNRQHLFFALLDDAEKVHAGGGIHNEEIVLEYIPFKDAEHFIYDESHAKTPGLMFAFSWFLHRFGPDGERLDSRTAQPAP